MPPTRRRPPDRRWRSPTSCAQCAGTYRDTHRLSVQQQRVVNALVSCRTAALGGFKACCDHCGAVTIQYASCRNRHCPKCQTLAQTRWVERQCAELLNIGYWHVYGK